MIYNLSQYTESIPSRFTRNSAADGEFLENLEEMYHGAKNYTTMCFCIFVNKSTDASSLKTQ